MMPDFTAFDPATRWILYSGSSERPDLLPHPAIEGVKARGATHRMRADLNGIEPKPELGATVDPLSINAGESVTVIVPEPVSVTIDGLEVGQIAGTDTVEFFSAGVYTLTLTALSGLILPQTETITVV